MAPPMYYGPVAHVAALQSMVCVRNFLIKEWDAAMEPIFTGVTKGTFPIVKNGHVALSDQPGLGLEMDWPEFEKRYPYKGQSLRPPGGH